MNVFTTDRPLISQAQHADTKKAALLLYLGNLFLVAFILWPFFFCFLWFAVAIDNNDTTDTPDPSFWMVFLGSIIGSLFLAFSSVTLLRLFERLFRKFWKKRLTHA